MGLLADNGKIFTICKIFFLAILIIYGIAFLLSALVGYKRGLFKSVYKFIGVSTFLILAYFTKDLVKDFVVNTDFSYINATINFTLKESSVEYAVSVPFTTLAGTLQNLALEFKNFFLALKLDNLIYISLHIYQNAVSLLIYVIDFVLIFIFGKILLAIIWAAGFKRKTTQVAIAKYRVKLLGMLFAILTFAVFSIVFMPQIISAFIQCSAFENSAPIDINYTALSFFGALL